MRSQHSITAMHSHHYHNNSGRMIVLRCVGPNNFFLEKVVFPFENWLFDSPPGSRVELWSHGIAGVDMLDSLSVDELQISHACDVRPGRQRPGRHLRAPGFDRTHQAAPLPFSEELVCS